MITEIIVFSIGSILVGLIGGFLISKNKRFMNMISKRGEEKKLEVINDPELLVKRLNENGPIKSNRKIIEISLRKDLHDDRKYVDIKEIEIPKDVKKIPGNKDKAPIKKKTSNGQGSKRRSDKKKSDKKKKN